MYSNIRPFVFISTILLLSSGLAAYGQSADLVTEHFTALNSHDIKMLAGQYADSAQVFSPNWEGAKIGPGGIMAAYTRYYKSTPDLTYTITNTIKAGNMVIVEYSWSGTMAKPEAGEPAYMEGKKYTLKSCAIFVIKNNQIVKETNYFDQVAFLRQVGFFDHH